MINNKGRILKGIGGFYYVKSDDKLYEAKATTLFKVNNIKLTVGDYVKFDINDDGTAYIRDIYERKNLFIRPPVSNIDEVFIVISIDKPKYNYQLIDRMILLSRFNGIEPTIILNKMDLNPETSEKVYSDYTEAGFKVLTCSMYDLESIDKIKNYISKKTILYMGVSGVGKSTLISELTNLNLETGVVSEKTSRGKHTTRHVELLNYSEDSYIVDTPGFSSLSIDFIPDIYDLEELYSEYNAYDGCKFLNCMHINEPSCSVKNNVKNGNLKEFRYENYVYFHEEIKKRR